MYQYVCKAEDMPKHTRLPRSKAAYAKTQKVAKIKSRRKESRHCCKRSWLMSGMGWHIIDSHNSTKRASSMLSVLKPSPCTPRCSPPPFARQRAMSETPAVGPCGLVAGCTGNKQVTVITQDQLNGLGSLRDVDLFVKLSALRVGGIWCEDCHQLLFNAASGSKQQEQQQQLQPETGRKRDHAETMAHEQPQPQPLVAAPGDTRELAGRGLAAMRGNTPSDAAATPQAAPASAAAAAAAPVQEAERPRYSVFAPYPSPPAAQEVNLAAPEVNLAAQLSPSVENGAGGGSAGGAAGKALMPPALSAGAGSTTLVSAAAEGGNEASVAQAAAAAAPLPGETQPVSMAGVATATQATLPQTGVPHALPLYGAAPTGQPLAGQLVSVYGATPVSGVPQAALWSQQTLVPMAAHQQQLLPQQALQVAAIAAATSAMEAAHQLPPPQQHQPPPQLQAALQHHSAPQQQQQQQLVQLQQQQAAAGLPGGPAVRTGPAGGLAGGPVVSMHEAVLPLQGQQQQQHHEMGVSAVAQPAVPHPPGGPGEGAPTSPTASIHGATIAVGQVPYPVWMGPVLPHQQQDIRSAMGSGVSARSPKSRSGVMGGGRGVGLGGGGGIDLNGRLLQHPAYGMHAGGAPESLETAERRRQE